MVSIIITVRERYETTKESVSSILSGLDDSVEVVFVAAKAPPEVIAFLEKTARKRKKFKWVSRERYLRSNEARNIGLEKINKNSDVVFIENDVVARKGWLEHMIRCARETRADIVGPLVFEGNPKKKVVRLHNIGANFEVGKNAENKSDMVTKQLLNRGDFDWKNLKRRVVDLVEFHCVFIRRSLLNKIGLDGEFDTLTAQVDLCFDAKKAGSKVIVEPKSHVVYANPMLISIGNRPDFDRFAAKWNEKSSRRSMLYMAQKWGMKPNGNFLWNYRYWIFWNKHLVFSSFGVLTRLELLFWRAIRVKPCPEWFRALLEKYLVMRIRANI